MLLLYTLMLGAVGTAWAASGPVIKTSSGTFEGAKLTAKSGRIYNAFRGIPYAKPPVGDLRFRPTVAADPVDGVYDATAFKPYCVQIHVIPSVFDQGQEDCLYLNVFTPRAADRDDGNLKKVLVFFHGGANLNGFTDVYIPGTLVTEHDIIVVTVAYRLGYLGLLSTLTPNCEGNLHLKDQLQSLVWVQKNILDFGGDPRAVTISGESAGAFDTSLLNLVPGSRDLFARAYSQSGATGVKNSVLVTNPRPEVIKLGKKFGCLGNDQAEPVTDSDFDQIVDCLRQVPAAEFGQMSSSLEMSYLEPVLYGDLFSKDIEELFSDEAYLKSIRFFERDYLIGIDQNEGGFLPLLNEHALSTLPEEVRKTLTPKVMFYSTIKTFLTPKFGPVSQEVIERVADYYENSNVYGALADFGADAIFHFPILQYTNAAAADRSAEDSRVYLFVFLHFPEWMPEPAQGIIHGFDLLYLFDIDVETIMKIVPVKPCASNWHSLTIQADLIRGFKFRLRSEQGQGWDCVITDKSKGSGWNTINLILKELQIALHGVFNQANSSKWNENDELLRHRFINVIADFVKTGNPGQSLNSDLSSKWPGFDRIQQQYLEFGLQPKVKHHLLPERYSLWSEQIPKWIEEFPASEEKHEEL